MQQVAAIDQQNLIECQNGPQGDELIKKVAEQTKNVWPTAHNCVPWIVVNGISTLHMQADQENLRWLICFAYRGNNLPDYCKDIHCIHRY